jgi:hypothetical protein
MPVSVAQPLGPLSALDAEILAFWKLKNRYDHINLFMSNFNALCRELTGAEEPSEAGAETELHLASESQEVSLSLDASHASTLDLDLGRLNVATDEIEIVGAEDPVPEQPVSPELGDSEDASTVTLGSTQSSPALDLDQEASSPDLESSGPTVDLDEPSPPPEPEAIETAGNVEIDEPASPSFEMISSSAPSSPFIVMVDEKPDSSTSSSATQSPLIVSVDESAVSSPGSSSLQSPSSEDDTLWKIVRKSGNYYCRFQTSSRGPFSSLEEARAAIRDSALID